MTVVEKAKEAMKITQPSNGNGSSNVPAKTNIPTTMKGLKTKDVRGIIELYKVQIAQALPKHLTAERVIQTATTLISRTPEIAECSAESLIGAVMQSSILGFEPIPQLGQCYYVPFNNKKTGKREVQFIIGYKGMIDLARRSDKLTTIYAQAVYENDEFDYEFGLDPQLKHKPALDNRGEFKFAYAVAKFTNGGFAFEVMSKSDIDKIRKLSQAAKSDYSPWNSGFYEEMAKKTVLRRLWKYLPSSIEYRDVASDEAVIKPEDFKDGELDLNSINTTDYEIIEEKKEVREQEGAS